MSDSKLSPLRKRLALLMAGLVIVGAGGMASQAGFNDSAQVTASGSTGTVLVSADSGGSTTINFGDKLKALQSVSRTLTVKNDGSLPVNVSFTSVAAAGATGNELMDVKVDAGAVHKLSALSIPTITNLAAGSSKTITIVMTVPDTNTAQGKAPKVTITASAVQY